MQPHKNVPYTKIFVKIPHKEETLDSSRDLSSPEQERVTSTKRGHNFTTRRLCFGLLCFGSTAENRLLDKHTNSKVVFEV